VSRTRTAEVSSAGVAGDQSVASAHVLVTGMHRSGTSAVAEALRRAGLYGGDVEDLMPPTADNPAGYWELEKVRQYNDRLLASLGWAWDSPAATPHAAPPARPEFVEEGRRLVKDMTLRGSPFYLKDPRLSLLLPWWRQILLDRFVTIVALRPPDEVAWSLSVRDGFPVALGAALWSAYHRHLANGLRGLPVIVIDYPALLANPSAVVREVLLALDSMGVRTAYDEASAAGAIRPSLRRATHPSKVIEKEPWAASTQRVHATWAALARGGLERFEVEPHGVESWEVALLDTHRNLKDEQKRTTTANELAAAARLQAEAEHAAATAAGAETDFFRVRVADLQAEREELAHTADDLRADADALRDTLGSVETERDQFGSQAEQLRAEAESLRTTLGGVETERGQLSSQAARLRAEAESLRTTLGSVEAERDDLRAGAESLRTTLGSVEAERDDLRIVGDALRTNLGGVEAKRDQLSSQAEQLRAEAETLRTTLDSVQTERDDLQAAAEALRATLGGVEIERDQLSSQAAELRAEAETVRTTLISLETERDELKLRLVATERYGRIGSSVADRHPSFERWLVRPLRALWLLATFRLWRHLRENPLFDGDWYLHRYPDLHAAGVEPRSHYWSHGVAEGYDPNPLFDTGWYLTEYPDVAASGLNPLDHYFYFGGAEGRAPSPKFDGQWYLLHNPDVLERGLNPLFHYLRFGVRERREVRHVASNSPGSDRQAAS
jgi:hypothetical protein